MIEEFKNLSEEEVKVLKNAPVWVTLLVAGADSTIDNKEIDEAVAITKLKQSRAREALIEYYKEIGPDFEKSLREAIANLSGDSKDKLAQVEQELTKLNDILPKIDASFASALYASLKDFAKKVAEASGGVFGYGSISYEESKLIKLPMLKEPGA